MNLLLKSTTYFIVIFIITTLFGCGKSQTEEHKLMPIKYNYIVLLDLSDRILSEGQIDRDISVIGSVYKSFLQRLQSQFYFPSIDEFKIVLAYQQNAVPSSKMFELEDQLYINVEKVPLDKKKDLRNSESEFTEKVKSLYKLAHFSDDPNQYKGADIQGYLRDRLSSDIPKCDSIINFLVIVTDGYQYVEGKSKGIDVWPSIKDLSDINIMVVEMAPRLDIADEQEKMLRAWNNWLVKMNARSIRLETKSALTKVYGQVSEFLNKKNDKNNEISPRSNQPVQNETVHELSVGSDLLPNGDYVSIKNGKVRTLKISKNGKKMNKETFVCSIAQLGNSFSNLNGELDLDTGLFSIEKLGIFSINRDKKSITLSSNANDLQFTLRLVQ